MSELKAALLKELRKIAEVEDRASPVPGGTALFYKGKPFAHFHNDHELDLRLTGKTIKTLGLVHPIDSAYHPKRSRNSAWIEVRFDKATDVARISKLAKLAIAEL